MYYSVSGMEMAETTCSRTSIAKLVPDAQETALTGVLCSISWPCSHAELLRTLG